MIISIYCFHCVLQIPKQSPEKPTVESPADIYSQFTSKKELKSILRKPSFEENDKKDSVEDKSAATQPPTDITKENTQKEDFNSQKVRSAITRVCSS